MNAKAGERKDGTVHVFMPISSRMKTWIKKTRRCVANLWGKSEGIPHDLSKVISMAHGTDVYATDAI